MKGDINMKNIKNKIIALVLSLLLFISCLSGCLQTAGDLNAEQPKDSEDKSADKSSATDDLSDVLQDASSNVVTLSASLSNSDANTSWDESDTKIILNGSSVTVYGQGAKVSGSVVTITAKGTYVVSGMLDNGQIVIETSKSDKVHLVLNGTNITNKTGAAIYASQCDKLIVTLAEGTQNSLTDGGSNYVYANTESEEPNAALFCKDDLTINGTGSLTVTAGFNNGIGTKDDLLVVSGDITVNAANHGMRGNDSVTVLGGSLNIISGNDGIRANNSEDASLGYITIEDGDITIKAGGGYPGKSIKVNKKQMNGGMGGRFGAAATTSADTVTATEGGKGINASGVITINGGTFDISAYDDAVHGDTAVIINGGNLRLETGATGIQALDVTINDGIIGILNSFEGIEGEYTITGNAGTLNINANDDGINISASTGTFTMNGGDIIITAQTDGIDSNGNIVQTGGKITITVPNMNGGGDGPIDYDGTFTRTGGTMVDANGNELSTEKMMPGGGMGGRGMR